MSALYLSDSEISALKEVDIRALEECITEALAYGQTSGLYNLHLGGCGLYISGRLQRFQSDLGEYAKAKMAKKREQTRSRAWSSGDDLLYAVREMVRRMEEEEKELQLIRIDDMIRSPRTFDEHLEIRVQYQWRRAIDDAWAFGKITFIHDVDKRPDYLLPQPARKPSAAKLAEQRQETLYRHWDHFRRLALHAVREYLKKGGDGSSIPETFVATTSGRDRFLNNFSCDFWRAETSNKAGDHAGA